MYPLEYKVLVRPDKAETESGGGIVFTTEVVDKEQNAQVKGVLIACGPIAFEGWDTQPIPGANVLFAKYAGIYVISEADGENYRLMNDKDIVAIRGVSDGD